MDSAEPILRERRGRGAWWHPLAPCGARRSAWPRRLFRTMITGMAAVALPVGGVGILAIMLVSVRERRSEIGLRIAVGARRKDVWLQFLIEAVSLDGAGGLLGLGIGTGASWIVSTSTDWAAVITPGSIATAVASALVLGMVFGVYPAVHAVSWDPVDALGAG